MRITAKGQLTIPIDIRRQLRLLPDTEVEFEVVGDAVQVRPARGARQRRAREIVERLRGSGSVRMTTDELLAMTRGDDWRSHS